MNNKKSVMMCFLMCVFVFSCNQDIDFKQYNYDSFAINSPKDWSQSKTKNIVVFKAKRESSSDTFLDNFNVIVQGLGEGNMSLKDYSELTYNQIKQAFGDESILEFKNTLLSDKEAKEIIYSIPRNPASQIYVELKAYQKWVIKDNKAFVLTFTAQEKNFEKNRTIVEKMFDSFKLK